VAPRVIDTTNKVLKRMRAGNDRALAKAAAHVRGVARKSIGSGFKTRTNKATGEKERVGPYQPSLPGRPPKSPTDKLRNAIAFNVDRSRGKAAVGPTRRGAGRTGRTHEFGGREPAKRVGKESRSNNWVVRPGGHGPIRGAEGPVGRSGPRFRGFAILESEAQVRRAHEVADAGGIPKWDRGAGEPRPRKYPARPFMGPALVRSRTKLPAFWKNALRGN